jgi:hypothetical protein
LENDQSAITFVMSLDGRKGDGSWKVLKAIKEIRLLN